MAEETEQGTTGAGGVNQPTIVPPVVSPPIAPSIPVAPPRLSPPTAPPTVPGALMTASMRQVWPTTIGIIGIVISGLGLIGALWAFGMAFSSSFMWATMPPNASARPNVLLLAPELWMWYVLLGMVRLSSNAWLLVVAIQLLKRKKGAAVRMRTWALCAAVLVLVGAMSLGIVYFNAMEASMSQIQYQRSPGMPSGAFSGVSLGMGLFAGSFAAIVGLAYPVFILIWMRRASVREHAATWGTQRA